MALPCRRRFQEGVLRSGGLIRGFFLRREEVEQT